MSVSHFEDPGAEAPITGAAIRAAVPAAHPTRGVYRQHEPVMSPLRYPGAKRRMVGYVADTLAENNVDPQLFVELFAGGASVAIQLLADGVVEAIGLVDRDVRVASFWKSVFWDRDWLLDQIDSVPLDLATWRAMRTPGSSRRAQALACIYLNRTNFSGIIAPRAGPLGGTRSFDATQFACRFPRETLRRRVRTLSGLAGKVRFVWSLDWHQALGRIRRSQADGRLPRSGFYFLDPPFFHKAERLYSHWFTASGHRRLRDALVAMSPATEPWLLTYDSLPDVRELYGDGASVLTIDRFYTTSKLTGQRPMFAEAVATNLATLPSPVRLARGGSE